MGVLGGPGAFLVKPWGSPGHYWGAPGGPWKVLWGLLGRPCGRPSTSDATHTHVSAFRMFSCVSIYLFVVFVILFCFVLCLCSPWGSGSCSWEALRVPRASLRVFWVPWEVLGSSWGVLGDSLKVHEGQIHHIYKGFE